MRRIIHLALFLALLPAGGGWAQSPGTPLGPAMFLPATTAAGSPLDLAAQKTWRVIYFWSAHCPCVRDCEHFSLIPLAKQYRGRVAFCAVASNRDDLDQARASQHIFAENVGTHTLPYAVVLDPAHAVANRLGAVATPEVFLLDPHNRIVFQGAPDDSWTVKAATGRPGVTKTYLADALGEALSGNRISLPRSHPFGCSIFR